MRLINVELFKLEEFFGGAVPRYAILSHTWGNNNEELSFRDVEEGRFENAKTRPLKFEGCCEQAKKDGLQYAWIDTCCIDKSNTVEVQEAINSMFQWYKRASVCYTYLSDVHPTENPLGSSSKVFSSRWFERGWTLQELLAPKTVQFYNSEWSYLGTKKDMSAMIEKITCIPRPFLLGMAELRDASVAQRMSWAAKRVTKREEDIAYCLLGIFGVSMPMIYGEGADQAFIRLQVEVMRAVRDDSILAWGLSLTAPAPNDLTELISDGVLAAAPSDFVNCGQIISRERYTSPTDSFDIFGGSLQIHLPIVTNSSNEMFGLLKCGPAQDIEQLVGLPLVTAMTKGQSVEYIRPQGRHSTLLPKPSSEISTSLIYIRKERQSRTPATRSRQYWFYIEESVETNLELIDVEPRDRWQRDHAMITTETESNDNITQRTLTRFRYKKETSRDFIIVLDFETQNSQMQARCHVMVMSRDTTLQDLAQKSTSIRQEAFGKHSASSGVLNLNVTLREELVAGQLMFVVRLARVSDSAQVTVDATLELEGLNLKSTLESIRRERNFFRLEMQKTGKQLEDKKANLEAMKSRLEMVDEQLGELGDERKRLVDGLEKGSQKTNQLAVRGKRIGQLQCELLKQSLLIQMRLHNLSNIGFGAEEASEDRYKVFIKLLATELNANLTASNCGMPVAWTGEDSFEGILKLALGDESQLNSKDNHNRTLLWYAARDGHDAVVKLLIEKGAEVEPEDSGYCGTPLSWAAENGHETVVQQLLAKGAKLESKDINCGRTPLLWAARNGHEAVVQQLLDKGAGIESEDMGGSSALLLAAENGHESVVQQLLAKGAKLESKDIKCGRTPLLWAARNGHEAVVQQLLDNGAGIESEDTGGSSALLLAAENGHESVVQQLLAKGAKLESKDIKCGRTPLLWAARNGHEAAVQQLLNKGTELDLKDGEGSSALLLAAKNGHEVVVQQLLDNGAELESEDTGGKTPLAWAAENGHRAVVKLLLEKDAKFELRQHSPPRSQSQLPTPLASYPISQYYSSLHLPLSSSSTMQTLSPVATPSATVARSVPRRFLYGFQRRNSNVPAGSIRTAPQSSNDANGPAQP